MDKPQLNRPDGIDVGDLKRWLAAIPDEDPVTGEPRQVFISNGNGTSSPLTLVSTLNASEYSCDVFLEAAK